MEFFNNDDFIDGAQSQNNVTLYVCQAFRLAEFETEIFETVQDRDEAVQKCYPQNYTREETRFSVYRATSCIDRRLAQTTQRFYPMS